MKKFKKMFLVCLVFLVILGFYILSEKKYVVNSIENTSKIYAAPGEAAATVKISWNPGYTSGNNYTITIHYVDENGNPILSQEKLNFLVNEDKNLSNKKMPLITGTDIYLDHLNSVVSNGVTYNYSHIIYDDFNSGVKIKPSLYAYQLGNGTKAEKVYYNIVDGVNTGLYDAATERELALNADIYLVYKEAYPKYKIDDDKYVVNWERGGNKYTLNIHYVDTDGNVVLDDELLQKVLDADEVKASGQQLPIINGTDLWLDKLNEYAKDGINYFFKYAEIETSDGRKHIKNDIYARGNDYSSLYYNLYDESLPNGGDTWATATEEAINYDKTYDIYLVYQAYPYFSVTEDNVYSVKWFVNNSKVYDLRLHYVDEAGNEIIDVDKVFKDLPKITAGDTNLNLNSVKTIKGDNGKEYIYSRTLKDGNVVKPIVYGYWGDNNLYYNTFDGMYDGENVYWLWDKTNEQVMSDTLQDFYIVYSEKKEALPLVKTVDSKRLGLNMYMFNFSDDDQNDIGGFPNINDSNYGAPTLGLYSSVLDENGFPTIETTGKSLSELFNDGTEANHLFLNDVYTNEKTKGILYYNSGKNFAHFNEETSEFEVYDALGTSSDVDLFFNSRGNFMPYNSLDPLTIKNYNWYSADGSKLTEEEGYGENIYGFKEDTDYNFGLYADGKFTQTANGLYNNKPMIYDVVADDDMLVYIDDVLVLDLGGVHDAQVGNINFQTGVITWSENSRNEKVTKTTTFKDIFNNIEDKELKALLEEKGWSGDNYVLAADSEHEIKIFYMERGQGASDLALSINLPLKSDYIINPDTFSNIISLFIIVVVFGGLFGYLKYNVNSKNVITR